MEVIPYDRARFEVYSHGETLLVDCLTLNGNGSCTCLHYLSRIKPAIESAQADKSFTPSDKTRCPHITAARAFLMDRFIEALRKQFPDNEDHI